MALLPLRRLKIIQRSFFYGLEQQMLGLLQLIFAAKTFQQLPIHKIHLTALAGLRLTLKLVQLDS
jgi:hypothetical protein